MDKYLSLMRESKINHTLYPLPAKPAKPPVKLVRRNQNLSLAEIIVIIEASRRGAYISPTPHLLEAWRQLNQRAGAKVLVQSLGALVHVVKEFPGLSESEQFDFWLSGLDGANWRNPVELADEVAPCK